MDSKVKSFAEDFGKFIESAPSSFHAADQVAQVLRENGFKQQLEDKPWDAQPGGHFVVRDGAILAYRIPAGAGPNTAFRILGCHTDSPSLKLKPNPDKTSPDSFNQLGVEIYGGALINSWLDRDLEVAGRVVDQSGQTHLVRTGPIMRVPQLAVHLDRAVNDGLKLDKQRHIHPIWGVDDSDASILQRVAELAGLDSADQILGYDLVSADTQAPQFLGARGEFLAGGRMDNLVSVFAGMRAFIELPDDSQTIPVLACFDHEEIGSATRSGAAGSVLPDVLQRISLSLGADREQHLQALSASSCLSSDVGHSVHPNYSERHDPDTRPVMGRGPILKLNANQRYTTDARGTAIWQQALQRAGVSGQQFVSNNTIPCGSTIGPFTAAGLGVLTVDVGIPILSMHSIRELCHIEDLWALSAVCGAYWSGE